MQLRDLEDGARFRVIRTGQIAIKLGAWGDEKNRRVVQYQGQSALSTLNHQVAVSPLTGLEECAA
ncbi:hypothetical protein L1D52_24095 [Vibrio brasiliensis]|uniref:hypothetical protein n=1 Tax=Vibrio brasiliensis TaxID=170652 RepID=UPI001EFE0DAE|nr:hypothetical protein [Vibrio brasiliensis]MCG9785394.1 hypothetical protein [Vibrio brasiliensis]